MASMRLRPHPGGVGWGLWMRGGASMRLRPPGWLLGRGFIEAPPPKGDMRGWVEGAELHRGSAPEVGS